MDKPNIIYKIMDRDGLFSTGGSYPSFNSRGKSWQQRGHLSNHLAQLGKRGQAEYIQRGCKVVTYEVVQIEADAIGIQDYLDGVNKRRQVREEEHRKRVAEFKRERDIAEMRRIAELYPDVIINLKA